MAISINDVAKKAGVARSTVSYVLNDGPGAVRPELRDRVLTAVRELHYRPSRVARSMVTRRTGTIGVIHAPIRYDLFGATFVQGVLNGVARHAQMLRQDISFSRTPCWTLPRTPLPTSLTDVWTAWSPSHRTRTRS